MSDKDKKDNKFNAFTSDSDGTGLQEMPTVSSLLRRKKAMSTTGPVEKPTSEPAITLEPETLPPEPAGITLTSTLAVTPSKRGKRTEPQLIAWTPRELARSEDPLAGFVQGALKAGATQGLFLSILISESSKSPQFIATAYFGISETNGVWQGLRWNPRITPQIWKKVIADGFIDLPPPSADTNVSSERNVARNALGASPRVHVSIVRVGPATSCRGLLVVISPTSLAEWVDANSKEVFAPLPKASPETSKAA